MRARPEMPEDAAAVARDVLTFFPRYEPFGLREIRTISDARVAAEWLIDILDARETTDPRFSAAGRLLLLEEVLPALEALVRIGDSKESGGGPRTVAIVARKLADTVRSATVEWAGAGSSKSTSEVVATVQSAMKSLRDEMAQDD